jgi:hypothetical protein
MARVGRAGLAPPTSPSPPALPLVRPSPPCAVGALGTRGRTSSSRASPSFASCCATRCSSSSCSPHTGERRDLSSLPTFPIRRAQERDRTADLVLTKDVLCQLSYLGPCPPTRPFSPSPDGRSLRAGNGTRTRDPELGRLVLYQLSYSRLWAHLLGPNRRLPPMERGGFEPPKAFAGRFTVCSRWPLGYLSLLPDSARQPQPMIGVEPTTY